MRRIVLAVLPILLIAADPLEGDKFLEKADEKFDQTAERADLAHAKAMGEAYEARLRTYRGILTAATKAGNFDRATAVKARIQEIEAERDASRQSVPDSSASRKHDPLDVLHARPFFAYSDGEIHWEKDHIFLHSRGHLRFEIPEGVKRFTAEGVINSPGNVKFVVLVDNVEMYRSEEVIKDKPAKIDVPVKQDSKVMEIITDPNGANNHDHGLWYSPRFWR